MRLLLTHTPHMRLNYFGDKPLSALRALVDVRLNEDTEPMTPQKLIRMGQDADFILSDRMTPGPAAVFPALPALKVFLRCAVDIRTIDLSAASRAGVLVTRASPTFADSVAELAIGFIVDLARGVSRATGSYRNGAKPTIVMGRQLAGSTIGIIGYGIIGRRLAQIALALRMRVLAADPHAAAAPEAGVEMVSLRRLLLESDHVVCLATSTEDTANMMNAEAFACMREDSVFINLSRGELVDDAALAAVLREGRIAGAALDVGRAPDQMPMPELARLPNVIATPHIGGLTPQTIEAQAFDTVHQIQALVSGMVPHGAVNAEHWTRRPNLDEERPNGRHS